MKFNTTYIKKLIKCKRIGKIIKLIENNLYNWSDDNYVYVFRSLVLVFRRHERDELTTYYLFFHFVNMKKFSFSDICRVHYGYIHSSIIKCIYEKNHIYLNVKYLDSYYANSYKKLYTKEMPYVRFRSPFRIVYDHLENSEMYALSSLVTLCTNPRYINIYLETHVINRLEYHVNRIKNISQRDYIKFLFYDK